MVKQPDFSKLNELNLLYKKWGKKETKKRQKWDKNETKMRQKLDKK